MRTDQYKTKGKETVNVKHFDSLHDIQQHVSQFTGADHNRALFEMIGSDAASHGQSHKAWFGVSGGADEVRALVSKGWAAGVKKIEKALDVFEGLPPPVSQRRRRVFGDMGDSVDMGKVWAGNLDKAWQRTARRDATTSQNITIAVNVGGNQNIKADDLFWRGAAALKFADMATAAGYNVEIIAFSAVTNSHRDEKDKSLNMLTTVTVKDHSAPLDLNALASTICLGGFFRMFILQSNCNMQERGDVCFGRSVTAQSLDYDLGGAICGLDSVDSDYSAKSWIEKQLKALNGGNMRAAA